MYKENVNPSFNMDSMIKDATNQFFAFKNIEDEEDLRDVLKTIQEGEGGFKTLEQWTGKTTEELNNFRHGICEDYNSLVEKLKNPNLSVSEAKKIGEEVFKLIYHR